MPTVSRALCVELRCGKRRPANKTCVRGSAQKKETHKFLLWTCPEASKFGSFMAGQRGEMLGHQTTQQIREKTICVSIGW